MRGNNKRGYYRSLSVAIGCSERRRGRRSNN